MSRNDWAIILISFLGFANPWIYPSAARSTNYCRQESLSLDPGILVSFICHNLGLVLIHIHIVANLQENMIFLAYN